MMQRRCFDSITECILMYYGCFQMRLCQLSKVYLRAGKSVFGNYRKNKRLPAEVYFRRQP